MNTEKQIELDKVKEIWMQLAVTESAKEAVKNATFYLSESQLKKQLKDTTDSRNLMEKLGMPPLQNVSEIREVLMAAEKGGCLLPDQLERVEKILVLIRRLKDYLKRGQIYDNPLACYEENFDALEELREEIYRQIRSGEVDDYASKELSQIRSRIVKCEEAMKQKAEQVMRSNRAYMADNYCTLRNGRICVPVKREYKLKISGSVVDQSSSGSTLFIEPSGVARQYEELQLLKIGEENEVYRILYTLTAMVADAAGMMYENIRLIEKLDFIFSKGKLSMDMDASEPLINTERRIILKDARHPLMDRETCVPLQFEIGGKVQGIVITGPNTGGKTVAIKTVMLNCIMAQYGLHVTCRQEDICMNTSYLCDIGDGQNMAENLSTFSSHIKNVLEILSEVGKDSFVIMDELGSGTDPAEGMGIAIAILEELRKSGAVFLVTTHYPEVVLAAYGEEAVGEFGFQKEDTVSEKKNTARIIKSKKAKKTPALTTLYKRGDSVMVYPDKKIGIVCTPVNEKGVLRVQLPDKKIWINHKRVKLHVAAVELYPEDYDFSIVFDSVANRKIRHEMERKYTEKTILEEEF